MAINENSHIIKQRILLYLIAKGSQMIPTIAEDLEISVPTINKYICELIDSGEIINLGKMKGQRGRQPNYYSANPNSRYYVGVDIKNNGINIGVINLLGEMVLRKEDFTFTVENTPAMLETICSIINETIDTSGIDKSKFSCIAINLSGRVDTQNGYSYSIFNFEGDDEPLSEILTKRLGIKTYIENDTRAMTYAELVAGEGANYKNFLFANVGWGIGLGIVIDGKLYYGTNGYSGEFGHINVYNNEIMCHCGKKGCLETEISGRAIHRKLLEHIEAGKMSYLSKAVKESRQIDILDIISTAIKDDTLCIELIENAGTELGRQLANMINIFNPEAVIIGGPMFNAGDYFLSPVKLAIRKYSLRLVSRNVKVSYSSLKEQVGVIGACMTARQRDVKSI